MTTAATLGPASRQSMSGIGPLSSNCAREEGEGVKNINPRMADGMNLTFDAARINAFGHDGWSVGIIGLGYGAAAP